MRVVCENCGASYKIPESKLVKEVNKATCRKCGYRMMIRRPAEAIHQDTKTADPTEAATQVTANPLERQDAEREILDAATRIEEAPANEWEEDSPTNVQSDPSAPPPPTTPRPNPTASATGRAATDMTVALFGTIASAGGAMLLATNTGSLAVQRMGGLSLALWGALTCLFLLVTGNLWRQKGNVPISVALATVLSLGGTGFVELALHGDPTSEKAVAAVEPAKEVPPDAPKAESVEPVAEGSENEEEVSDPVAAAEPPKADAPVPAPPVAEPPSPTPPGPANSEALDEPDFEELTAVAAPPPSAAEERRRREMEEAAEARANERRQREAAAAQRQAAAERARREAAAAAAPPAAAEPPKMKSLPLTVVDTLIRTNMSVKKCFYNEKQSTGQMPTRVNVRFTVLQSGRVSSARVITEEYKGGTLDSCLSRSFKAIPFPAFEGDSLTMNYPFVL